MCEELNKQSERKISVYKKCPKCNRQYGELHNYCSKCGIELERDNNRCSENKTTLCAHSIFADDDTYCSYCGALTTYALDRQNKRP